MVKNTEKKPVKKYNLNAGFLTLYMKFFMSSVKASEILNLKENPTISFFTDKKGNMYISNSDTGHELRYTNGHYRCGSAAVARLLHEHFKTNHKITNRLYLHEKFEDTSYYRLNLKKPGKK